MPVRQELLEKLLEYKSLLESDERVLRLEEEEKKLQSDAAVFALSSSLKKAEDAYEEARSHFGENSDLTKKAQKDLYTAKVALDNHETVKAYNQAYIAVKDVYLYVDDVLFGNFRSKKECGGHHA